MHGSLLDININGVSFVPVADVDANFTMNEWDNEAQPNGNGPASVSSVRKVPGVTNVNLRVDSTEVGFLKTWSNSAEWVEFFSVLRDGSVWGCLGLLKLDEYSSANGTAMISIQCKTNWDISAA